MIPTLRVSRTVFRFVALMALLAACAPSPTATPTLSPAATTPATPRPTLAPPTLPPTWTPTHTYTPPPPTATPTVTLTPTPLDPDAVCASFRVRYAPDPDAAMAYNDLAYFVWSDVPRGVSVRLVIARPREFQVMRAGIFDRRNNGILVPLQSIPFSGRLDWQLLLIYEGEVLCRLSGQMQKAAPPLEILFATPTLPTVAPTPGSEASPTVAAETETATPHPTDAATAAPTPAG